MADLTMTLSFSEVQRLLKSAAITPKKSLGQNFVVDPNTVRRMARLAGVGNGSRVLEIGAGLGSLTLALAETGAQVTAIETDRALIPLLKDAVGNEARIIEADVRALSWERCRTNTRMAPCCEPPLQHRYDACVDGARRSPKHQSAVGNGPTRSG